MEEEITLESLRQKNRTEIYDLTNKLLKEKDVLSKQLNSVISSLMRIDEDTKRRDAGQYCEDWY